MLISNNYKTLGNSAGSSLCEYFLCVNLYFTEQLSVSIFGVCGFFGHSGVPLLKPRGHYCSFVDE